MLRLLTILICSIYLSSSFACSVKLKQQDSNSVDEKVLKIICKVIEDSFSHLKQADIKLKRTKNPEYYLASNFNISRLRGKKHGYLIHYNPEMFTREIPDNALEAILAHELVHTHDYFKSNIFRLIGIGMKFLNKRSIYRYERKTDLVTILNGIKSNLDYLSGLKAYRKWIYKQLEEKKILIKKKRYYSPREFELLSHATQDLTKDNKIKFYQLLIKKAPLKGELQDRIKEILLLI